MRSAFGHTEIDCLNKAACKRLRKDGSTEFENWIERYHKLEDGAKNEDYVKHHLVTYDESELPVWVAVELLDFGAVTRLFSLLQVSDQNAIAKALGVSSGKRLHSMLLTSAYVRNLAAHHSRTWNRVLTVKLPTVYPTEVGPDLTHLAGQPIPPKMYGALAVMAYLIRNINPASDWARKIKERVGKKFPTVPGLSAEADMAFPEEWTTLPLWADAPRRQQTA